MTLETWKEYTDQAKVLIEQKQYKQAIISLANENNIKPIDLDEDTLLRLGVTRSKIWIAMKALVDVIIEYYWIKLRELNEWAEIKEKYSIEDKHYEILMRYWDVWYAYAQYVKQYKWEWENADKNFGWEIRKTQVIPDTSWYKKILKSYRETERNNLLKLIEMEADPKKKELYELQLKTLDLKNEIDE